MRKIKRPNILVKPREVFYRLKRSNQLENLDEVTIEEILSQANLKTLVDPGCVYENFTASEIADSFNPIQPLGAITSLAIATLGDCGFEECLKKESDCAGERLKQKIFLAWAAQLLDKLVDFTSGLIREEAAVESLEIGSLVTITWDKDSKLWRFLWERLTPQDKLKVQRVTDPLDGAVKILPSYTRAWFVPWLTKKEKKQLAMQTA